jgi:hypothetical protein
MKKGQQSYRAVIRAHIAERRSRVSHLYLTERMTQQPIAQALGCSISTVSEDLGALRAEWRRAAFSEVAEHIALELHKINQVEAEAHAAYERSRKPKRIASASKKEDASGTTTISSATQIERDEGDVRFLMLKAKCTEMRIRLLGLDRHDTDNDAKNKPHMTLADFIAAHQELEQRNGNGTSKARLTPIRLDPNRLP